VRFELAITFSLSHFEATDVDVLGSRAYKLAFSMPPTLFSLACVNSSTGVENLSLVTSLVVS
jgi:hypothetical protein